MSKRRSKKRTQTETLRTPVEEQLLIEGLDQLNVEAPERILAVTTGRGQFAAAAAARFPSSQVVCNDLDLYRVQDAQQRRREGLSNLHFQCEADLPLEPPAEVVAVAVHRRGEAELTRDWLQAGMLALKPGGRMLAAVNNPGDQWLHEEMRKLFPKVTRQPHERKGVLYLATRSGDPKKIKNFEAEFAFRDNDGRLIHAVSRPGVFSHRRVDGGARALMAVMEIHDGDEVLEIGCGSGVVSLSAAFCTPSGHVTGLDSNPRAVACTLKGAKRNGLNNVTALLDAAVQSVPAGRFDVVLSNPPYFSQFRIAELFVSGALRAMKPEGRLYVVTKNPDWFYERLEPEFKQIDVWEQGGYFVIAGAGVALSRGKRQREQRDE